MDTVSAKTQRLTVNGSIEEVSDGLICRKLPKLKVPNLHCMTWVHISASTMGKEIFFLSFFAPPEKRKHNLTQISGIRFTSDSGSYMF